MIINLPVYRPTISLLKNGLLLNLIIALYHTDCYSKQFFSIPLDEVFLPLEKCGITHTIKESSLSSHHFIYPIQSIASMLMLESSKVYFLLVYIIVIIVLVIFLEALNNKKKNKLQETVEGEECFIEKILIQSGSKRLNSTPLKDKELMSCEAREEILKKLQLFEEGTKYTDKNFNLSALSVKLKTNSKYLSYIINKYKKKDFNTYINELRIHYIIRKMESNPAYLHYKISYLADECGFSSHSKFTAVFGSIVGMSPSYFMDELSKKHTTERSISKK